MCDWHVYNKLLLTYLLTPRNETHWNVKKWSRWIWQATIGCTYAYILKQPRGLSFNRNKTTFAATMTHSMGSQKCVYGPRTCLVAAKSFSHIGGANLTALRQISQHDLSGHFQAAERERRQQSRRGSKVHSVSGWTRGVQVKLWDPLRTRAIPERLKAVFTTRRYTNPRLPIYLYLRAVMGTS